MSRTERTAAYELMLQEAADMQLSISQLLEAKAQEAEKACHWLCSHYPSLSSNQKVVPNSLRWHGMVVEVIEGLTRLSQGNVALLNSLLQGEEVDEGEMNMEAGEQNDGSYR